MKLIFGDIEVITLKAILKNVVFLNVLQTKYNTSFRQNTNEYSFYNKMLSIFLKGSFRNILIYNNFEVILRFSNVLCCLKINELKKLKEFLQSSYFNGLKTCSSLRFVSPLNVSWLILGAWKVL